MEEKSTSGAFLECLEKIMELEKRKRVQEKTVAQLDREIASLGIPKNYLKPVEREAVYYAIEPDSRVPNWYFEDVLAVWEMSTGVGAIIGIIVGFASEEGIMDSIGGAIGGAFLGGIIGALLPIAFMIIHGLYATIVNAVKDGKALKASQTQYEQDKIAAHNEYLQAVQQYQNAVAADAERVNYENSKKRTLQELRNQLDRKHDDTDALLGQFYAASGLYQDYTNFVAVTHIYEYLKSGICSKLSGTDGAYMVFKYEMHEKHKEEQLDTLIQKVDELHFDNMILNRSLGEIGSQVERLTDSVDGFRSFYQEASTRQEAQLAQTGERLRSLEESYIRNSEITQYNQRCIESELELSNWLEVYRYANNR